MSRVVSGLEDNARALLFFIVIIRFWKVDRTVSSEYILQNCI